jgi:sphingomyelin phosphodiesterase
VRVKKIFTGDMTSHDDDQALGRAYLNYTTAAVFTLIKSIVGKSKVYTAVGNHDSWPQVSLDFWKWVFVG